MSGNPTLSLFSGWNELHGGSMERNSSSEIGQRGEAVRRSRVLQLALQVTAQLTLDLPDNGVKHARVQEHTARVFLVLEQIRGNSSQLRGLLHRSAELMFRTLCKVLDGRVAIPLTDFASDSTMMTS